MPSGWATHMPVEDFTPAYLRQVYLANVNLGVWVEPPTLPDGSPNPAAGQLTPDGTAALQALINGILADVQAKLGIRFEQQRLITDPDDGQVLGVDYDIRGERLMYFRPAAMAQHYTIPLPYSNVVSIERVRLFSAAMEVYEMPRDWISFTSKEGVLRVTPLSPTLGSSQVHGNWGSLDALWFRYGYRDTLPNAWSLDYTFGHGQLDDDVARYVGLTAAIEALAMAGAMPDNGGGLSNESLSMDGVSESIGHYQGKYGPFTGLAQAYQDALEKMDIWQMRLTKKGIKLVVW